PDPPTVNSSLVTTDEDTTVSGMVSTSPATGVTVRLDQPPLNGTVTVDPSGAYVYVPDPDYSGQDEFTVIATLGQADSLPGRVTVLVQPVNDAPLLSGPSALTVAQGGSTSGQAVGTDVEGDALFYFEATPPSHGTLTVSTSTGSFVYTPAAGFTGADFFELEVTDGQLTSAPHRVDVVVQALP
ncbi:MAG: Ig-like domain-containing protein, partial [Myxococcota bacterium]